MPYEINAPINVKPQGGGGGGYLWEIDSENLPWVGILTRTVCASQGREFDMPAILEHRENLEMSYPQS